MGDASQDLGVFQDTGKATDRKFRAAWAQLQSSLPQFNVTLAALEAPGSGGSRSRGARVSRVGIRVWLTKQRARAVLRLRAAISGGPLEPPDPGRHLNRRLGSPIGRDFTGGVVLPRWINSSDVRD